MDDKMEWDRWLWLRFRFAMGYFEMWANFTWHFNFVWIVQKKLDYVSVNKHENHQHLQINTNFREYLNVNDDLQRIRKSIRLKTQFVLLALQ